jgi:outer membrane protein TolC
MSAHGLHVPGDAVANSLRRELAAVTIALAECRGGVDFLAAQLEQVTAERDDLRHALLELSAESGRISPPAPPGAPPPAPAPIPRLAPVSASGAPS